MVRVIDDGVGMTRQALRDGWLVVGKSGKQAVRVTERKRRVVGNKGLGRLAALRLGESTKVTTWPIGERVQYSLEITWSDFDVAKVVERFLYNFCSHPAVGKPGNRALSSRVQCLHSN